MNKILSPTMDDVKATLMTPDIQEKALASVIVSESFSTKLVEMAKEFDSLKQDLEDSDDGPTFITMKVKMALLRKYFNPFELQIDFNHMPDMRAGHIVQATVLIMTEVGLMKWFSRYGMAVSDSQESSQGCEVDAESSAKRRVLAALGLGGDYHDEVIDNSQINLLRDVQKVMDDRAINVSQVIAEMTAKAKGSILVGDYAKMPAGEKSKTDASLFDPSDLLSIRDFLTK